jgi:O-antigen ligase
MANNAIERINWGLAGVAVAGLVLATFVAISIGNSDYLTLACLAAVLGLVAYIVFFQRYTWQIALLICYTGLFFWPLGFRIGATELTCGLAVLLAVITGWQKRSVERVGILKHRSFSLLRGLLLLWIVYVAIHMWYNIYNPLLPSEFALKNALKTYFDALMPIALLWYFSGKPTGIRIRGNFTRTLAILLLVGVIFNIAITCYGILTHHNIVDPEVQYRPAFLIPGINAFENPYMLRVLGPAAVLFGATTLYLRPPAARVSRTLSALLVLVGSLGSLISGGRAAIVTAVLLVLAMLLFRKQIGAFLIILVLSALFVLFVNVFSDWINHKLPIAVARPLQWVMVSKNKEAEASIESSSRWREELFKMSIAEWRSDPRIFWFGRATYAFGVGDYVAPRVYGGFEAGMESSLRRGETHNLLTDLLVTYGLVGCILYYAVVVAIICFLWIAYRSPTVPSVLKPLRLICLTTFVSYPITASIAAGLYSPENMWLLVVFVAALYQYESLSSEPKETIAPLPEPVRRPLAELAK